MKTHTGGVGVTISSPDKVLFPEDGISKGELAAYYRLVAPLMLPHVRGRPLTMERFPDGIGAPGFFHKDVVRGFRDRLDSAAREARYIAMIEAPPLKRVTAFVEGNIERGYPQLVALDGDRVVGWCDVIPHRRIGFSHGGLLGMGVRASHRRRGIGRRLLSAALAAARALGLLRVELEVYASNAAAISLYEKTGSATREGDPRHGCSTAPLTTCC